jgi:hypothetical protein
MESEKVRTEGRRKRGEKKDENDDGDDHERKTTTHEFSAKLLGAASPPSPSPKGPKEDAYSGPTNTYRPIFLPIYLFGLRAASHTTH